MNIDKLVNALRIKGIPEHIIIEEVTKLEIEMPMWDEETILMQVYQRFKFHTRIKIIRVG